MNQRNHHGWMHGLAAAYLQSQQADPQTSHLTLITTDSPLPKTRKPKMIQQQDYEAKAAARIFRRYATGNPMDHVSMVHNALSGVRDLALPSGSGYLESGVEEDFQSLGRNAFVDLIEILNDRLGVALELADLKHALERGDTQ